MQEAVVAVNPQGQVSWSNAVMQRICAEPGSGGARPGGCLRDPEVLSAVGRPSPFARPASGGHIGRSGPIFEVNAAPMLGGGVVAVLHDVTEIERAEKTRRDFVANVSHELRTPLTSISGYVETLLDDGGLTDQAREFLQSFSRTRPA